MQPYLFPYIGYFQLLNAVDEYVIYDDVQYIKGGWINRNNLLIGGQKVLFTFQLNDASPNKLINEIEIKSDFTKFLKTVQMAYSKAPYKTPVCELLERICAYDDKNLARFIGNSIMEIAQYLSIDTKIIYSSELEKDNHLAAQDKIIAICQKLDADVYINAIGGRELYNKKTFTNNDIDLKFLQPNLQPYKQLKNDFIPGLSIIDVLMFNSSEEIKEMMNCYELI